MELKTLFLVFLSLVFVLLGLLLAYSIIYSKYQYGVYIPTITNTEGHELTNVTLGDADVASHPLVLYEHSRKRKIEGGFIVRCGCNGTNKTVIFTVSDDGAEMGREVHTFNSTNNDVIENVVVKFTALKTTGTHSIKITSDNSIELLEAHYYYY